ncbi:MAG: hypothetical protein M3384_18955, partial [Acidobacteriota bacterium]|nr:hypothetical protein [Acidobacteriota bacterium]
DKASRVTKRCYTKQNVNTPATECSQISNGGDLDPNTPAVEYFYDGKGVWTDQQLEQAPYKYSKGKLTKVTSSISETRYTLFDNLGRLTQSQQITDGQTYTSGYEYNLSGAMVREIYPSGREVRNEFGTDGDLQRIYGRTNQNAAERTYASGFAYTPDGRIQRLKLGNNRWESAQFNNRLQVTELALGASNGDGSLWKLNYEYGELQTNGTVDTAKNTGNIARQTLSFNGLAQPLVQSYKYDSLYRLTEAKETASNQQNWIQQFAYDRFGNRTGFSQNGNGLTSSQTPTIDVNTNRFVTTGQNFVYDKNGNLVTDGESRQFVFNGDNKQTEVKNANGLVVGRYFYDGEGKRVKKKVYEQDGFAVKEETVFVYSVGKLVAEYSTAPAPQNPTTSYTATDHLGSPRVITDANGQVTSRRDFMPFGEELLPDNNYRKAADFKYGQTDSVRQRFTGYQKDNETQLDFAEARMYENSHGRFTAVDPLLASGKSANPQTFNRYVYVDNNPLVFTDPSGMCKTGQCPATYSGIVYTKKINGRVHYNNERPDDTWGVLPKGTDVIVKDATDKAEYRIYNLAEGNSGWFRIAAPEGEEMTMLPSKWFTQNFLGEDWGETPIPRGGRFTITDEGETNYEAFVARRDEEKVFTLMLATQNLNFGAMSEPPKFPSVSRTELVTVTHRTSSENLFSIMKDRVINPSTNISRLESTVRTGIWVSEGGVPNFRARIFSGRLFSDGAASVTFQVPRYQLRPAGGVKAMFGPVQRIIPTSNRGFRVPSDAVFKVRGVVVNQSQ